MRSQLHIYTGRGCHTSPCLAKEAGPTPISEVTACPTDLCLTQTPVAAMRESLFGLGPLCARTPSVMMLRSEQQHLLLPMCSVGI